MLTTITAIGAVAALITALLTRWWNRQDDPKIKRSKMRDEINKAVATGDKAALNRIVERMLNDK
jgi:uncharacterized protein YpmS